MNAIELSKMEIAIVKSIASIKKSGRQDRTLVGTEDAMKSLEAKGLIVRGNGQWRASLTEAGKALAAVKA